jgi:hypothetical protein
MKLSVSRGFHKALLLRWIARRIPPRWCFLVNLAAITLGLAIYPHAGRSVRPLAWLLTERHDPTTVRRKSRDHLLYRRWQDHLEFAWENWAWRMDDFVRVEGTAHLSEALSAGQGAVLLSAHYYGLDRLVDPILAQKGYAMSRWANPLESESIEDRWGKGDFTKWKIIDFRGDFWHHTQRILSARKHLKENRAVHLSVRGQPDGEPESLVQNNYKSFFLEPKALLLVEMLNAPVLPCFAIPDDRGNIVVNIYPRVPPVKRLVMESFGALYSKHLNDHPEFTRIWRRVMRGDPWW